MKRKWVITTLCTMMLATGCQGSIAGTTITANAAITFSDVASHWAKASVETAVSKKYVDGYEDGTFRPEQSVSRAEFLKMVVTATDLNVTGSTSGSDWYKPYLTAATDKGLVRGTDFPLVEINKPITRLEMARIAVRSTDTTLQNKAVQIDDLSVMYNATKTGLIQGLAKGELAPQGQTTRAQSVTIIERILKVQRGEKLEVDKYARGNAELALLKTNIFTVMPEFFDGEVVGDAAWRPDNLYVESKDGLYRGVLDQLIAIDLEDPNDPNLGLLGDINTLRWDSNNSSIPEDGDTNPFVKDYRNSYVLFNKSRVEYVKDSEKYNADKKFVPITISGIKSPDIMALHNGVLNGIARVYQKKLDDLPAIIVPKSGAVVEEDVFIKLYPPERGGSYYKTVLQIFKKR